MAVCARIDYRTSMKILCVRQAAAVPERVPGVSDAERPLMHSGKAKFTVAAHGLAQIARTVDVVLTSPLRRSRQTAEIVARVLASGTPVVEPALAGGDIDAILSALALQPPTATVAMVADEPVLAAVLRRTLDSGNAGRLTFRRGGAAMVDLPDGPTGRGRLVWFNPPRVLRALAGVVEGPAPSPIASHSTTAAPIDSSRGAAR
jgi:phosphohistidine phosphatase SixA